MRILMNRHILICVFLYLNVLFFYSRPYYFCSSFEIRCEADHTKALFFIGNFHLKLPIEKASAVLAKLRLFSPLFHLILGPTLTCLQKHGSSQSR